MGVLFALSAQPQLPQLPGPWLENVRDKIGHALSYAVLTALCWRALRQSHAPSPGLAAGCAAIAVAYGISDEVHQMFVPGRTASLADLAADAAGAVVMVTLLMWQERRRKCPPRQPAV
jgi:VanZ family protein